VKYGALAAPLGRIDIAWHVEHTLSEFVFTWREHCKNCTEGPRHSGFGTELLQQTLRYELGAETVLDFGKDDLNCTIRLPIVDRVFLPSTAL
jgi:two-component sensor histidine kinase